jgi:hypothetical protein
MEHHMNLQKTFITLVASIATFGVAHGAAQTGKVAATPFYNEALGRYDYTGVALPQTPDEAKKIKSALEKTVLAATPAITAAPNSVRAKADALAATIAATSQRRPSVTISKPTPVAKVVAQQPASATAAGLPEFHEDRTAGDYARRKTVDYANVARVLERQHKQADNSKKDLAEAKSKRDNAKLDHKHSQPSAAAVTQNNQVYITLEGSTHKMQSDITDAQVAALDSFQRRLELWGLLFADNVRRVNIAIPGRTFELPLPTIIDVYGTKINSRTASIEEVATAIGMCDTGIIDRICACDLNSLTTA